MYDQLVIRLHVVHFICNHTCACDKQIGPRLAVVRFCYHSYYYRPNWTPFSPITITYYRFLYTHSNLSFILISAHNGHVRGVAIDSLNQQVITAGADCNLTVHLLSVQGYEQNTRFGKRHWKLLKLQTSFLT